jgi:hypothetical protein
MTTALGGRKERREEGRQTWWLLKLWHGTTLKKGLRYDTMKKIRGDKPIGVIKHRYMEIS